MNARQVISTLLSAALLVAVAPLPQNAAAVTIDSDPVCRCGAYGTGQSVS